MRTARCYRSASASVVHVQPNLRVLSGYDERKLRPEDQKHACRDPVVIDPADPQNNVAARLNAAGWTRVVGKVTWAEFAEFLRRHAQAKATKLQ